MVENVAPTQAWEALKSDPNARLVDVRTDAEWNFVGVPDLSETGKQAVLIPWQVFPTMQRNPSFEDELKQAGHHAWITTSISSVAAAPAAWPPPRRRARPASRMSSTSRTGSRDRPTCTATAAARPAGRPMACPGCNADALGRWFFYDAEASRDGEVDRARSRQGCCGSHCDGLRRSLTSAKRLACHGLTLTPGKTRRARFARLGDRRRLRRKMMRAGCLGVTQPVRLAWPARSLDPSPFTIGGWPPAGGEPFPRKLGEVVSTGKSAWFESRVISG